MLTVVTWLWQNGNRDYDVEHVNRFYEQFDRHYRGPYERLCITDLEGVDARVLQMPPGLDELPGRSGNMRRLWIWSLDAAALIGGRVFVCDIDCDIVGPLNPLLDRDEDVVLWHDPRFPIRYSGGNMLITLGSRPEIWERFIADPVRARSDARNWMRRRYGRAIGAEMAWLSYAAGDEATFGPGIYRARKIGRTLPKDAVIVHYSGDLKPYHPGASKRYPWLC